MPIVVTLAGTPTGKGRPRFRRETGHTYTPEKTRDYETNLRIEAQHIMGDRPLLDGPLRVDVVAAFDVPKWSAKRRTQALAGGILPTKKPDADNLLKVLDALNGVVWLDDSQIVVSSVRKVYAPKPSFTVTIEPIILPGVSEMPSRRRTKIVDIFA